MAPICADSASELQEVARSYKLLVKNDPATALIGEQLEFRMRKALAELDQKMQTLVRQVKQNEVTIMELQKQSAEAEKVTSRKFQAEKEMWARKERAAHKRKFPELHNNDEEDNREEDSPACDEQMLANIFEEMKRVVAENPGCAGKTPIGVAFDEIRNLIESRPPTSDEGNTTAFLIEVMELARKLVNKFNFDSRKSLGGSFRRIRRLLPK